MRILRVLLVAPLVAALSGASSLPARTAGSVSGYVLDPGGRPLAALAVELVATGSGPADEAPQQTSLTDGQGAWSFPSVPAGEYVVRIAWRGRTAGVPVSVAAGSGADGVLLVAPSLPPAGLLRSAPQAPGPEAAALGGMTTGKLLEVLIVTAAFAGSGYLVVLRDAS